MKNILNFDFYNKVVILRCDFNVPIKEHKILDDTRIRASLKTLNYLISKAAKVVILSHLGKVKTMDDKDNNNLVCVFEYLKKLVDFKVYFCEEMDFDLVKDAVLKTNFGEAILLQNTRFYDLDNKMESSCSEVLSRFYSSLGDIFIFDAFAVAHRAHASVLGISKYIESGIGFLVMKELEALNYLKDPKRPFVVMMGGAKVGDKTSVIESLIAKVDYIFIGGAMSFAFLKAKGLNIGKSFVDEEGILFAKELLEKYSSKIILPKDFVGKYLENEDYICKYDEILDDFVGFDIGPLTINYYKELLKYVKTVFWNGPFGVYEDEKYSVGTCQIIKSFSKDKFILLGGGDIVACVNMYNLNSYVSFVSTGGGATLKYLSNDLPILDNLRGVDK